MFWKNHKTYATSFFLVFVIMTGDFDCQVKTNDDYKYISTNEIFMWISNNGSGSHDPRTDGSGLYWPASNSPSTSVVFADGLVWGGKIDDSLYFNGNTHSQGLQAGKILPNGEADDPGLSKYRVYKIKKGWELLPPGPERDEYEKDYNEWPVEDGAAWIDNDNDGIYTAGIDEPKFLGDEVLFYVANDLDTSRCMGTYGSQPIGLEFQTTLFGYSKNSFLTNVVFKKYKIINKSSNIVDDMFVGFWSDNEIGFHQDDVVGCDTLRNLGYSFNFEDDSEFGMNPPAVGQMFLEGPINASGEELLITAYAPFFNCPCVYYTDPFKSVFEGSQQFYNYLIGLRHDGTPHTDPFTSETTKFPFSGDPVAQEGWYQLNGDPDAPYSNSPQDVRSTIASGPFTMAPGDTQTVVVAIFLAQGEDYLDSVTELKLAADSVIAFYEDEFLTTVSDDFTLPNKFELHQNYPNPFNPTTTITFSIPDAGKKSNTFQNVRLDIYNTLGQRIKTLVNEQKAPGNYHVQFDASGLASGIYFYQLRSDNFVRTNKMVLMK